MFEIFKSLNFTPGEFVNNLVYMGAGMLSIFVVIGAVIAVVYLLNSLTKNKKDNDK